MNDIIFEKISDRKGISELEKKWRKSLILPNDDFTEAMLNHSQLWGFRKSNEMIGFAFVNNRNVLLQFFVSVLGLKNGRSILSNFIENRQIKKAFIWTNDRIFLSLATPLQKSTSIQSYLFNDAHDLPLRETKGDFKIAKTEDLQKLVDFSHIVLDAPKDWLETYIENWIGREEFFFLEFENKVIGTCEVRTDLVNGNTASLGIVVSPEHRKQGIGSYLLGKAKEISKSRNQQSICCCDKDNIGSLKAIENNGFSIVHLGLSVDF